MNNTVTNIIPMLLGIALIAVSFYGWKSAIVMSRLVLLPSSLRIPGEFYRLPASLFVHADILHCFLNVGWLLIFSHILLLRFGVLVYALVWLICGVSGNVLTVYLSRKRRGFMTLGASAGVSGVVFCSLALLPWMTIPLVPWKSWAVYGWILAVIFPVLLLIFVTSRHRDVRYEGYITGGLMGIVCAVLLDPSILLMHVLTIGSMMGIGVVCLYLFRFIPPVQFRRKALALPTDLPQPWLATAVPAMKTETPDDLTDEEELNHLLEIVREKGMNGLLPTERARLIELSRRVD